MFGQAGTAARGGSSHFRLLMGMSALSRAPSIRCTHGPTLGTAASKARAKGRRTATGRFATLVALCRECADFRTSRMSTLLRSAWLKKVVRGPAAREASGNSCHPETMVFWDAVTPDLPTPERPRLACNAVPPYSCSDARKRSPGPGHCRSRHARARLVSTSSASSD